MMQTNDLIKATWPDGLVCIGRYSGEEQGYIILLSENNTKIVCNKHAVKFEIMEQTHG